MRGETVQPAWGTTERGMRLRGSGATCTGGLEADSAEEAEAAGCMEMLLESAVVDAIVTARAV